MKTPEPSKENTSAPNSAKFIGTDSPRHLREITALLRRPLPRENLDSQRIARLMAADEAITPYWKDGAFIDAPAALAGEYADALLGAPASYWQEVERLDPGTGSALLAWAQDHTERRDYPEFFAMLAEIGRIRDEQGEEAR